jgi:polyisoprenyl-teichoic acid--peptidoglycan teichoic acid transferase
MKMARVVALAGVAVVALCVLLATRSPVARALRAGQPVIGIVLGTDKVDSARHSDTLMAWSYDPVRSRLEILSIPRDTKIDLPGYRFRRINEVFAYHYGASRRVDKAAGHVMDAVRQVLNVEGPVSVFEPQYYVHVDYDGFRQVVDLLGGIEVHVDEPMRYDDRAGNYHIDMATGDHRLDGQQALTYVRFRGRSGDRGRILRQMEFLQGLMGKLSSPALTFKAPGLVAAVATNLHTNLGFWDVVFLALEAKHLRPERVNPRLLPGQPRGAYWEMDRERSALVVRQMLGQTAPLPSTVVKMEAGVTTVKVWNGTRVAGLALRVTRRLRAAGFDVLEYGSYNLRQTKTRVIDRVGDFEKAQRVARALGVDSVFSDVNPRLRTDVEVFLGDDYQGEK